MNAIRAIHPHRHEGLWVFDNAAVGLHQEPFVSGADAILDRLAADTLPWHPVGFRRRGPCRRGLLSGHRRDTSPWRSITAGCSAPSPTGSRWMSFRCPPRTPRAPSCTKSSRARWSMSAEARQ